MSSVKWRIHYCHGTSCNDAHQCQTCSVQEGFPQSTVMDEHSAEFRVMAHRLMTISCCAWGTVLSDGGLPDGGNRAPQVTLHQQSARPAPHARRLTNATWYRATSSVRGFRSSLLQTQSSLIMFHPHSSYTVASSCTTYIDASCRISQHATPHAST